MIHLLHSDNASRAEWRIFRTVRLFIILPWRKSSWLGSFSMKRKNGSLLTWLPQGEMIWQRRSKRNRRVWRSTRGKLSIVCRQMIMNWCVSPSLHRVICSSNSLIFNWAWSGSFVHWTAQRFNDRCSFKSNDNSLDLHFTWNCSSSKHRAKHSINHFIPQLKLKSLRSSSSSSLSSCSVFRPRRTISSSIKADKRSISWCCSLCLKKNFKVCSLERRSFNSWTYSLDERELFFLLEMNDNERRRNRTRLHLRDGRCLFVLVSLVELLSNWHQYDKRIRRVGGRWNWTEAD